MRFTEEIHEEPEINVIPLIDVILVLLIFFMATATFDEQTRMKLSLPQASEDQVQTDRLEALVIQISADGRFYVASNEVLNARVDTLKTALERSAGNDRSQGVIVRADARAEHQLVVTALDALGQLGFERISIATVRADTEAE
ncbi:MAG: biopolymer transporter ExbD [Xanthomonadales bacterium]|nr:biopolymer transporter ExbD [Xanthomonadales bacterium]MCB1634101.1 biopolymer transporter ExbD [Xanthomonadales bacterium]